MNKARNGGRFRHGLRVSELVALRWDQVDLEQGISPFAFTTESRGGMTDSSVRKIIARAGDQAQLGFPLHPHMLRHACGFKLANEGHDTRAIQHYLGHRNIQHTVRYTLAGVPRQECQLPTPAGSQEAAAEEARYRRWCNSVYIFPGLELIVGDIQSEDVNANEA